MQDRMERAVEYRARAATVRKIAEEINHNTARNQLHQIADEYEALARDMESKTLARGTL
jgi:hypothetical protein